MSLHKLTAGSGYDYLTRQVAVQDATEKGHTGLASYYTERGEVPGVWTGTGCVAIRGDLAGSPVSAEQMQALFGAGLSPVGQDNLAALPADASERDMRTALRLGAPFQVSDREVSDFRIQVARRAAAVNTARSLPRDTEISVDERARIRTEVATELFTAEHGRAPADARELSATIARHSRPRTTAVAGFDLTFSPPKSVSTLWAVADPATAARIETAHQQAVQAALRFVEQKLLFSREGARGVRQVEVEGLVAASFTHRDSRAGDPDLHTHVAVANKVRTVDTGKWLAVDGRVLYKGAVAASETYNTALVKLLEQQGLRFYDRLNDLRAPVAKRPVREIAGVTPALNERWSTRRADIEDRRALLVTDFQAQHGRPPSPVESIKLAQQATLETRDAKHAPRTLAEQRDTWHRQAVQTLGSQRALTAMVRGAFGRPRTDLEHADTAWFDRAADRILTTMEHRAATWQDAHLRAEAQRQIRIADITHDHTPAAVDYLVRLVKDRSISLARPDPITEPEPLRRSDGASVYTVAGAELFTSTTIMAAEQTLLTLAGRTDGHALDADIVRTAIEAAAGSAVTLNPGQQALVAELATSRRRLQLAIAPAGAGKTTAMHVLATAWTADGGSVIGLAPSATAAAQLRDQTGTTTDTLAKVVWSLQHDDLPPWAAAVGPRHLVIIDEAGMADTPTLATVTDWAVQRGASVRLVGDDQQLGAIGAGGILRDVQAQHGAVRLTELMRFTDPAEAAASLALRDGEPSALGFYLDHARVHVGDLTTITDHGFRAWHRDRQAGLDALMIAPTREIVADLNRRARTRRLHEQSPELESRGAVRGTEAVLADGNCASAGDTVITRSNDRRLRTARTDWVKNGDRWTVRDVCRDGSLDVQHQTSRRTLTLPRSYVSEAVELGYACTIHAAQGISVDTVHGVATGDESRQQLYTMLTRGRRANHVWLQTVTDGSPVTAIHPDGTHPPTPTDLLERILARDDTPQSVTTALRNQCDPRLLLGDATQRYLDGLTVAAEHVVSPEASRALDDQAETLLPGLTDEPAWPTLRSQLLLFAAHDADPVVELRRLTPGLDAPQNPARDRAAVLSWRLDDSPLASGNGPLPWLPAVPDRLATDPTYGDWLTDRADLIVQLAADVRSQTTRTAHQPSWLPVGTPRPDDSLVADVETWRAATRTDPADHRPTGPTPTTHTAWTWKRRLDSRLRHRHQPALQEWRPLLADLYPALAVDPFTAELADHLAALNRAGLPAADLVRRCISGQPEAGPLPDEHSAAALWWRITADLHHHYGMSPAPGNDVAGWTTRLPDLIGTSIARELHDSPYWPLLVDRVDDALQRGWPLQQLITPPAPHPTMDSCLALVCTMAAVTQPADATDEPDEDPAPDDLHVGWTPPDPTLAVAPNVATDELYDQLVDATIDRLEQELPNGTAPPAVVSVDVNVDVELHVAALVRDTLGPPEPTEADLRRMFDRADAWRDSPVSRERLVTINQWTQQFYSDRFPASWAQNYLIDRLGADLTDHPTVLPGHAPAGWTYLVQHLRTRGVTDQEMITAGVARAASTGRLIDHFRDRLVLPFLHDGDILGFVGRRNPRHDIDTAESTDHGGPKYLNTPETPLFHKGDQFYGQPRPDTTPVIVEGPLDAIAVSLGTGGRYTGLAPLGTALTSPQAALLAGQPVIIATDADPAGHTAAERDYWRLTVHNVDPCRAPLPAGADPASVLADHGPDRLLAALTSAGSQARLMINERLTNLPPGQALDEAAMIIAAQPPRSWAAGIFALATTLDLPEVAVRESLLRHVRAWNTDRSAVADQGLDLTRQAHHRARAANTRQTSRKTDPGVLRPHGRLPQRRLERTQQTVEPPSSSGQAR